MNRPHQGIGQHAFGRWAVCLLAFALLLSAGGAAWSLHGHECEGTGSGDGGDCAICHLLTTTLAAALCGLVLLFSIPGADRQPVAEAGGRVHSRPPVLWLSPRGPPPPRNPIGC